MVKTGKFPVRPEELLWGTFRKQSSEGVRENLLPSTISNKDTELQRRALASSTYTTSFPP